jgi:hypothetical protein
MRLITMVANMCAYAQERWAAEIADVARRVDRMAATSYAVACFLARNTQNGHFGVCWDVVIHELIGPTKTPMQWRRIIAGLVKQCDGLKKNGSRRKGRHRGRV